MADKIYKKPCMQITPIPRPTLMDFVYSTWASLGYSPPPLIITTPFHLIGSFFKNLNQKNIYLKKKNQNQIKNTSCIPFQMIYSLIFTDLISMLSIFFSPPLFYSNNIYMYF